jgi:hypothetical protein
MAMPKEMREKAILDTKTQAAALLDDLSHFREVLQRATPTRGELRSLTATLRRLLIERALTIVAAPRIGRFQFDVPDNRQTNEKGLVFYFMGGYQPQNIPHSAGPSSNQKGSKMIKVRLDGFLSQRVLRFAGCWITRKQVLEFVAYSASGIHNPASEPPSEVNQALGFLYKNSRLADQALEFVVVPLTGGAAQLDRSEQNRTANQVDAILLELLSNIMFIVESEDTKRLEAIIRSEFGL